MPEKPVTLTKILAATALMGLASLGGRTQAATGPGTLHSVTLGWNASVDANIQGYRVHVGSQPGTYDTEFDTGQELSATIPGLEYGKTYYFAVRAINAEGMEGYLSDELAVAVAPPPLPAAGGLASISSSQLGLKWSFPTSALGSSPDFIIQSSPDLITWTHAGTVPASSFTGGNAQTVNYQWAITPVVGKKLFYRLTARNWMGDSIK